MGHIINSRPHFRHLDQRERSHHLIVSREPTFLFCHSEHCEESQNAFPSRSPANFYQSVNCGDPSHPFGMITGKRPQHQKPATPPSSRPAGEISSRTGRQHQTPQTNNTLPSPAVIPNTMKNLKTLFPVDRQRTSANTSTQEIPHIRSG